jgi:hypothetical protein
MSLQIGILIAGSLDWRNEPYRIEWRNSRLTPHDRIPVKAPIRYGRRSQTNTYTMVYLPGCPDGQAKVRLCKRPVAGIDNLIEEAKALWVAERPANARPVAGRTHSADWGCVALLANPNFRDPQNILNGWAARVALEKDQHSHPTYHSELYAVQGVSAIDNRGLLRIAWPSRADTGAPLNSCDLLLATATRPTPDLVTGTFPTAAAIAQAWNMAGNANYFRMNRNSGICTFQDEEIQSHLRV